MITASQAAKLVSNFDITKHELDTLYSNIRSLATKGYSSTYFFVKESRADIDRVKISLKLNGFKFVEVETKLGRRDYLLIRW